MEKKFVTIPFEQVRVGQVFLQAHQRNDLFIKTEKVSSLSKIFKYNAINLSPIGPFRVFFPDDQKVTCYPGAAILDAAMLAGETKKGN